MDGVNLSLIWAEMLRAISGVVVADWGWVLILWICSGDTGMAEVWIVSSFEVCCSDTIMMIELITDCNLNCILFCSIVL